MEKMREKITRRLRTQLRRTYTRPLYPRALYHAVERRDSNNIIDDKTIKSSVDRIPVDIRSILNVLKSS